MVMERERDVAKRSARSQEAEEQRRREEERRTVSKVASLMSKSSSCDRTWKLPARYETRQAIGTGSYGSVSEAYDSDRKQLVAIKRIGHMFQDLVDCKRILREISILSKLRHQHIVQIYDICITGHMNNFQELFIVMEICDSDLKRLVRTDVSLTPLHIETLLYNLLVGVNYLHSASIYHRDLKPANCLVNQDCVVKICDFGLSRALGDTLQGSQQHQARCCQVAQAPYRESARSLKRHLTGHVVTRWYRAPELILLQEDYTDAIDVWSVGCIYAELLGMVEGIRTEDRGPLFPGSSCFPLSPDNKHKGDYKYHTQGKHDQLNMIFNVLGTPNDADFACLDREDAQRYMRCFAKREGHGLRSKLPHIDAQSLDILGSMLQLNPGARPRVSQCLGHRLFSDVRVPEKETTSATVLMPDFEKEPDLDEALLRKYFSHEIRKYRDVPEVPDDRWRHGGA